MQESGSISTHRRTSVLSPTKASIASRHPCKFKKDRVVDASDDRRKDQLCRINQYLHHQEHSLLLDAYDGCGAKSGDLFLCIEHCFDCQSHVMSLRHDQQKYLQLSNAVLNTLVTSVFNMRQKFPFIKRVFAFRVKPTAQNRIGALEVTAAFKTRMQQQPKNKFEIVSNTLLAAGTNTWLTSRLHSKLVSL